MASSSASSASAASRLSETERSAISSADRSGNSPLKTAVTSSDPPPPRPKSVATSSTAPSMSSSSGSSRPHAVAHTDSARRAPLSRRLTPRLGPTPAHTARTSPLPSTIMLIIKAGGVPDNVTSEGARKSERLRRRTLILLPHLARPLAKRRSTARRQRNRPLAPPPGGRYRSPLSKSRSPSSSQAQDTALSRL